MPLLSSLDSAREEGLKQGIKQGMQQGRARCNSKAAVFNSDCNKLT